MITSIKLDHDQILKLLGDAAGTTSDKVSILVSVDTVTAYIETDMKGATRVKRTLDKLAKPVE